MLKAVAVMGGREEGSKEEGRGRWWAVSRGEVKILGGCDTDRKVRRGGSEANPRHLKKIKCIAKALSYMGTIMETVTGRYTFIAQLREIK